MGENQYLRISDHAIKRYRQRVHQGRSRLKKRDVEARIHQMMKKSYPVAEGRHGRVILEARQSNRRFYIIHANDTVITFITEEMYNECVEAGEYKLLPS